MINPADYFREHHTLTLALLLSSLCVSLFMALRMWLRHSDKPFFLKIVWTLVLLIPIVGWILYLGLFQPPPVQPLSHRARGDDAASIGGHGGL
jgi:type VI protein secretion system component VasK